VSDLWRKTLIYLGLVEEPEEHDEHELARQERADQVARERASARAESGKVRRLRTADETRPQPPVPEQTHVRSVAEGPVPATIVRPTEFDEAERIGERYRAGQPVLLDLGHAQGDLGRRLLDFVAGTIFALRGRIVPAGNRAFLLLPEGVEITPDERRRLADLGYSVQAPASPDRA
jgi:cell division inhibitor SepF